MHNKIMVASFKERPPMLAPVGDEPGQPRRVQEETYANTSPENRKLIDVKVEAIHMILNGISNNIYSTVDACAIDKEMWLANEYLMMKEVVRNKLKNPHQNEVNEIRVEKIARNDNPLVLVVATQQYPANHYQAPKPHKTYEPSSKPAPSTKSHAPTINKGKEISKHVTPPSESASKSIGNEVVQQSRIQCFNCMRFEHFSKECRTTKRANDYAYHKEKMMLCKQVEKDDNYNVFAIERQHSEQPESINDTYVVETINSNVIPDSSNM
ncbi:hypothetical protein Tco_0530638 [Tanacetum coccineum]